MAKEILGYYGPDASKPKAARATKGGVFRARDVNNYQPPQGPTSISNRGPGLGGSNYGCCPGFEGTKGREGGKPGLGGDSPRRKGNQR